MTNLGTQNLILSIPGEYSGTVKKHTSQDYPIRDEEYLSTYSRRSLVKACCSKGRCHPLHSSLMHRNDAVPGSRTWPEIGGMDKRDVESKDSAG